jgi:hypothetical protein
LKRGTKEGENRVWIVEFWKRTILVIQQKMPGKCGTSFLLLIIPCLCGAYNLSSLGSSFNGRIVVSDVSKMSNSQFPPSLIVEMRKQKASDKRTRRAQRGGSVEMPNKLGEGYVNYDEENDGPIGGRGRGGRGGRGGKDIEGNGNGNRKVTGGMFR